MLQLLPRRLPCFHRPVYKLRALGHFQLRRIPFQVVSAGSRYRPRCTKNSWPGNCSLFDRLLDFNITVPRALRFHVSQRRKALLQRPPRRVSSPRCPQRDSRLQDIRVVPARITVKGAAPCPSETLPLIASIATAHRIPFLIIHHPRQARLACPIPAVLCNPPGRIEPELGKKHPLLSFRVTPCQALTRQVRGCEIAERVSRTNRPGRGWSHGGPCRCD